MSERLALLDWGAGPPDPWLAALARCPWLGTSSTDVRPRPPAGISSSQFTWSGAASTTDFCSTPRWINLWSSKDCEDWGDAPVLPDLALDCLDQVIPADAADGTPGWHAHPVTSPSHLIRSKGNPCTAKMPPTRLIAPPRSRDALIVSSRMFLKAHSAKRKSRRGIPSSSTRSLTTSGPCSPIKWRPPSCGCGTSRISCLTSLI